MIGALTSLLIVMKGLPLAYSKDMQEDKEAAFDALDALSLSLAAMTGMIKTLTVNGAAMRAAAARGFSTATDLADWLVRTRDLPFRQAHHVTGALVSKAEKKGTDLDGLTLDEMREVEPGITDEVYSVLGVDNSVASRTSFGGTAPGNVRDAVRRWRETLDTKTGA